MRQSASRRQRMAPTAYIRMIVASAGVTIASAAMAQQPTAAQAGAIRSACQADYGKQCRGVPVGGKAAVACLQAHIGMVSARCRTAVAAATEPAAVQAAPAAGSAGAAAAPESSPPTAAQAGAIRSACQADYGKQCRGVPVGGKAAVACLQAHIGMVSARCRTAVAAATGPAAVQPAPAAGAAGASAAPGSPPPTAAQAGAIRSACQADYAKQCRGVPVGGKAAVACLQAHIGMVSARCRTAVAAATGPAAVQSAPAAGAASAAAAPGSQPPAAAQAGAIRSACQADYGKQCRGVPVGGKAAVACLQAHIGMVSARCRTAVATATGTALLTPPRTAGPRTPTPPAPPPTEDSPPGEPVAGTPPADTPVAAEPTAPPAMAAADPLIPDPDAPALSRRLPIPPLQELGALRTVCGSDFRALCANADLGGGRAVGCLKENASLLSPKCKRAVVAARTR